MLQGLGVSNPLPNNNLNKTPNTTNNKIDNDVDSLTKQLKELKIAQLEKEIINMKQEMMKPQSRLPRGYVNKPRN